MSFPRQPSESGILKKKEEPEEELLVFGYSCKLFRDDEKALYVDQGKHLIPWMGDDSLRVDRYDVRGALYDLAPYEAISGQQEELFWVNLSTEERRIEQLCDEERYRALTHNEDEERLYQEEELKRLHQALGTDKTYGQVSYSYDDDANDDTEKPTVVGDNQTEESDEPFVAPPDLDLPTDMVLPETMKLNAIIEKTATFITKQGSQMEIILKMKQASNPQFEFLSYGSPLHPYYRHVLGAMKTGRYKPKSANPEKVDEDPANQNYYLHHSLAQASVNVDVAPSIPSINYKPSSDCAYSMLVNKIRNNQNKLGLLGKTFEAKEDESVAKVGSPKRDASMADMEDVESEMKASGPVAVQPLRANRRKRRKRQQGGFAYTDDGDSIDGTELKEFAFTENLVDGQEMDAVDEYEMPPTELQLIIDKMACYVGKNGRNFEESVKSKADPRFSFLDTTNRYHVYYRRKVKLYECAQKTDIETSQSSEKVEDGAGGAVKVSQDGGSAQKPNPVCFSIKRPKETESLEIKSALPVEESSDEDNEENGVESNDNVEVVEHVSVEPRESGVKVGSTRGKTTEDEKVKVVKEKVVKDKEMKPKMSSKEREKQLQLERKKRAAAFLNSLQKNKSVDGEVEKAAVVIGPKLPDEMKVDDVLSNDEDEVNDESDCASSPPSSVTSPDVTLVSETPVGALEEQRKTDASPTHKRVKYASPRRARLGPDGVEYKHKHRKRKRSRSPRKRHSSHAGRPHFPHRFDKEAKRRKHRRHHRKEWRHTEREPNASGSGHRRHKHYKLKKHKRKGEKKYNSQSSGSDDSNSD